MSIMSHKTTSSSESCTMPMSDTKVLLTSLYIYLSISHRFRMYLSIPLLSPKQHHTLCNPLKHLHPTTHPTHLTPQTMPSQPPRPTTPPNHTPCPTPTSSLLTALTTAFPSHPGARNHEVYIGINRNAPGVFKIILPMTDHQWRGFCECGLPGEEVCRLDEKKMDGVVARFGAWAYVRGMRGEVCLSFFLRPPFLRGRY